MIKLLLIAQLVLVRVNSDRVKVPVKIDIVDPVLMMSLPDTTIRYQIAASFYSPDTILLLVGINYRGYFRSTPNFIYLYLYQKPFKLELYFDRNVRLYRTLSRKRKRYEKNRQILQGEP